MEEEEDAAADLPAGDEGAEPAPEPISPEQALAWLAAARPASVLALLRDPDFALVSMTAFLGFRVNATGFANPLVRRRLAQEIRNNEKLAGLIQALAEESRDEAQQNRPSPDAKRVAAKSEATAQAARAREDEWKEQRERLRRERDEARAALAQTQRETMALEGGRKAAEAALAEQTQRLDQQSQRVRRLERQLARVQSERTALLKALRQDKVSTPPRSSAAPLSAPLAGEASESANSWQTAVEHLLHKGKADIVLTLAQDVLRSDPVDPMAIDLAAQAYASKDLSREAAVMLRRLLTVQTERGEITAASETVTRLLPLLPPPLDARREIRAWLLALRSSGQPSVGRAAMERLRSISPNAHAWLEAEVRASLPQLAEELMPPPGALGADDLLPLDGGWSARRLREAVNANAEHAVTAARAALERLNSDVAARVWTALAAASEADDSVLVPLRRAPRGPVVVDGSNAAWFDQQSFTMPRARLRPILELRRALRRRGYFPVLLYADAPLPYTIDDPTTLRAMLGRNEIVLVDSGVDADEVLLREAKRYQAPLVTNDYMADWDPQNDVKKIQYTISLNGEAHLAP